MSKLFIVTVETEMVVCAKDAREAEQVAKAHIREEDTYSFGFYANPNPVNDPKLVDSDLLDSIPWGAPQNDHRTVAAWLEEKS